MKVQINAGALVAACDRFILREEMVYSEHQTYLVKTYTRDVTTGWWFWRKTGPIMNAAKALQIAVDWEASHRLTNGPLQRAILFRSIAKHKNPNTLLEITDPELEGIAPYLAEYSDPNGRIE